VPPIRTLRKVRRRTNRSLVVTTERGASREVEPAARARWPNPPAAGGNSEKPRGGRSLLNLRVGVEAFHEAHA
jgi:hypothetical protein